MKTRIKILLVSSVLASFAQNVTASEEHMTYAEAMASHKKAYGQYSKNSITAEESQRAWDSHNQKPDTRSTETVLWQQSGGLNNGTIVLDQPYSNFDKLKFYGTTDGKTQGLAVTWETSDIDYFQLMTTSSDTMTIWYNDNERWNGRWKSDKRTFIQGGENARIHKVVGINN